jgi:hypothetical protein
MPGLNVALRIAERPFLCSPKPLLGNSGSTLWNSSARYSRMKPTSRSGLSLSCGDCPR